MTQVDTYCWFAATKLKYIFRRVNGCSCSLPTLSMTLSLQRATLRKFILVYRGKIKFLHSGRSHSDASGPCVNAVRECRGHAFHLPLMLTPWLTLSKTVFWSLFPKRSPTSQMPMRASQRCCLMIQICCFSLLGLSAISSGEQRLRYGCLVVYSVF